MWLGISPEKLYIDHFWDDDIKKMPTWPSGQTHPQWLDVRNGPLSFKILQFSTAQKAVSVPESNSTFWLVLGQKR